MNLTPQQLAYKIRSKTLEFAYTSGGAHLGGIYSIADIVAVMYSKVLRIDPKNPDWDERDRVILSKGHTGAAIYIALSELGFFPKSDLDEYTTDGGKFSNHILSSTAGVDFSTGSLGIGITVAPGMALGLKSSCHSLTATARSTGCGENPIPRVYCIVGDGETDEGNVWEVAKYAPQAKLGNLTVIVDCNGQRISNKSIYDKDTGFSQVQAWKAFNWNVIEIDGHNYNEIEQALTKEFDNDRPVAIIANTVKGKGLKSLELDPAAHHFKIVGNETRYKELVVELENYA
jgi:transketolase